MIIVNHTKCTRCGICLSYFEGYCLGNENGIPVIDDKICNQCQKCIALCPQQAITVNHITPEKISGQNKMGYSDMVSLLSLRRSVKRFVNKQIPGDVLEKIAGSAKFAPNQNKNIDILIIDDPHIIHFIDRVALKSVRRWYRLMFTFRPVTAFISLFAGSMYVIRKKMERDLYKNKHIVKENTSTLMITTGNPGIPVTEMSAQYLLGTMILTAVSLDVGCTLMDSLKLTINHSRVIKRSLGIKKPDKALGVLALGYSNEKIVNIPRGYEINLHWNRMHN
jgi:NAD-dependent dihydropyrimidine dehydrogenase PreA subunit